MGDRPEAARAPWLQDACCGEPPDKERSKSAEKPAIIFGRGPTRKRSCGAAPVPFRFDGLPTHPTMSFQPVADTHFDMPTALVLDTNVVLDWLVFRDLSCMELGRAIHAGRARWFVTEPMRDELEHVLTRPHIAAWQSDPDLALAEWGRWAQPALPAAATQLGAMRCTDPDDQKFIDLALQLGDAVLLSRDRAVLRLARAARQRGVHILSAAAWAARTTSVVSG